MTLLIEFPLISRLSFSLFFLFFAVKVCEKQLIIREKKERYVKREREVMHMLSSTPGFVSLLCTFQDTKNLYFVMTLAKNGDLLPYINKVGSFDFKCTQFYAAELILAIEHMHHKGIVHRDLKPENILLDEKMHTLIADFGSARILDEKNGESDFESRKRTNSFVGTAHYVSPEILKGEQLTKAADLWAIGCIIYQMISGLPPFRAGSEYLIFQKILERDLNFPEGFNKLAKDLVQRLIQIEPIKRLGAKDQSDLYESIRNHEFFDGIVWDKLRSQTPPPIHPYLPGLDGSEETVEYRVPEHLEPGLGDEQLRRLLELELGTSNTTNHKKPPPEPKGSYLDDVFFIYHFHRIKNKKKNNSKNKSNCITMHLVIVIEILKIILKNTNNCQSDNGKKTKSKAKTSNQL